MAEGSVGNLLEGIMRKSGISVLSPIGATARPDFTAARIPAMLGLE